ncbi:MAG: dipeptidase [Chloroflexota bacterium]|nr:MAG: dipeptidase [Chloroflexota bacterium]
MKMMDAIQYANKQREKNLDELKEFLALPTISTLSEHRADVQRGAEWVAEKLRGMGMENIAIMPTGDGAGQPLVYAEWLHASDAPTILVYGHLDVQPVDPLNEWLTNPFEPTIVGDWIYARGASDMKAQTLAVMKALEALLKTDSLRVNIKVIVEGEEEVGSPNFGAFLREYKEKLKCDVALNCDSQMASQDLPSIVYGLRGLCYFEIWVYGPAQDLHSGLFGGTIHNPAQVLCDLISGMHDAAGRVTLPHFYDEVRELSETERAELARLPITDEGWANAAGVSALWGEKNFSVVERAGARPTLEVNGLYAGFIGEGSKTVLPAKAMAKISTRLVPNQRPEKIKQQLEDYLRAHAPDTVRWTVEQFAAGEPVLLNRDSRYVRAAQDALQETFGVAPVFQLLGWSVPVTNSLNDELGVDVVVMGFGLADDGTHGPNEHFYLPNFYRGIESYIRFFQNCEEKK